jgi:type IV conjugative transfer system protein TraE
MLKSTLEERYNFTKKQRRFFFVLFLASSLLNIILGISFITKERQIILVPLEFNSPLKLTNKNLSPEYLRSISQFFSENLLNNLTKDTVKAKFDGIGPYLLPEVSQKVKAHFKSQEENLGKYDNGTKFEPVTTEVNGNKVKISGNICYFRGKEEKLRRKVDIDLDFMNKQGQLFLADFNISLQKEPGDDIKK